MKDIGFYIVDNKEIRKILSEIPSSNYYVTRTYVQVKDKKETFQYYQPTFSLLEDGETRLVHISLMLLRKSSEERLKIIKKGINVISKNEHQVLYYLMMMTILSFYANTHTGVKLTEELIFKSNKKITIYKDYLLSYFNHIHDANFVTEYNHVLFKYDFSNKTIGCIDMDYQILDLEHDILSTDKRICQIRQSEALINTVSSINDKYNMKMLSSISTNVGWNFYPIYILYEYQNYVDIFSYDAGYKYLKLIYDRFVALYSLFRFERVTYEYYDANKDVINLENCYVGKRNVDQYEINGTIILILLKKLIKYNFKQNYYYQHHPDVSFISSSVMDVLFPLRHSNNYFDNDYIYDVDIPYSVIEDTEDELSESEDDVGGNNTEMYYETETYR